MALAQLEPAAERFDRDWLHIEDDRKERTLDLQSEERKERRYVDYETGESAVIAAEEEEVVEEDEEEPEEEPETP